MSPCSANKEKYELKISKAFLFLALSALLYSLFSKGVFLKGVVSESVFLQNIFRGEIYWGISMPNAFCPPPLTLFQTKNHQNWNFGNCIFWNCIFCKRCKGEDYWGIPMLSVFCPSSLTWKIGSLVSAWKSNIVNGCLFKLVCVAIFSFSEAYFCFCHQRDS